jgi:flagellar biosynthetic protein FliR
MQIEFDLSTVVGFLVAMVRCSTFVALSPPFASTLVPWRVKTGIIIAISLAIGPSFAGVADPTDAGAFVGSLLMQALIGATLGFTVWLFLAAIASAGDLIDLSTGFSIAAAIDPISARQLGPIGRLYELMVSVLLFTTGAHTVIIRAFVSLDPGLSLNPANIANGMVAASAKFFVAALEIAIPMMAVLMLAEVILGLVGRAAPQLNLFVLGLAAKSVIALVMLSATIIMLPSATDALAVEAIRAFVLMISGG